MGRLGPDTSWATKNESDPVFNGPRDPMGQFEGPARFISQCYSFDFIKKL